ncbi:alpha/beta hydrolase family protein [Blastomonas sp.]|uniref:alpha/beta hydrolase family protein n=1 Tax=Blastomonas sp. TaxID=1909299 RepID=UPI00391DEC40
MLIQYRWLPAVIASVALAVPVAVVGTQPITTAADAGQVPDPAATLVSIDPVRVGKDSGQPMDIRITAPIQGEHLSVVVLSHGNQLSRTDYAPLVRHLAAHGYVVVQPDHPDASVDGLMPPGEQPADTWLIRVRQLAWLAQNIGAIVDATPLLEGRIDVTRMAVIGHSFGGHSAALVMGAGSGAQRQRFDVPAYRAAILLAPPGNFDGLTDAWKQRAPYLAMDWSTMRGPVLTVNGSADMTPLTDQGAAWHDDVWKQAPRGRVMCLMTVAGAGHYLGGIDSFLRAPQGDATVERRTRVFGVVTAFLDAALSPARGADFKPQGDDLECK